MILPSSSFHEDHYPQNPHAESMSDLATYQQLQVRRSAKVHRLFGFCHETVLDIFNQKPPVLLTEDAQSLASLTQRVSIPEVRLFRPNHLPTESSHFRCSKPSQQISGCRLARRMRAKSAYTIAPISANRNSLQFGCHLIRPECAHRNAPQSHCG